MAANVSSARDLTWMALAALKYSLIRQISTTVEYEVNIDGRARVFHNTNSLVKSGSWDIGLSKTGYVQRGGQVSGIAGLGKQQVHDHPAARFLGQTDSYRRRQSGQALNRVRCLGAAGPIRPASRAWRARSRCPGPGYRKFELACPCAGQRVGRSAGPGLLRRPAAGAGPWERKARPSRCRVLWGWRPFSIRARQMEWLFAGRRWRRAKQHAHSRIMSQGCIEWRLLVLRVSHHRKARR